ncbi:MAG TPA: hypothetical protein DEH78_21770 [Solibacterales bacterium]|nr:hypothetical protein [Bryobacterales bacterium]
MKKAMGAFALTALLALPGSASQPGVEQIIARAEKIENEAADLAYQLGGKKAGLASVPERFAVLNTDLESLRALVASLQEDAERLSPQQRKNVALLREIVADMNLHVEARKELLRSEGVEKHRDLLRAQMDGLARRSELVRQTAGRLRG